MYLEGELERAVVEAYDPLSTVMSYCLAMHTAFSLHLPDRPYDGLHKMMLALEEALTSSANDVLVDLFDVDASQISARSMLFKYHSLEASLHNLRSVCVAMPALSDV